MSEIKQPEDHAIKDADRFDWKAPNGQTIVLKPFKRLPVGVFRKAKSLNELEATFAIIEAGIVSEDGLEVIDALEMGDLDKLFNDWAAASGVDTPQS